MPEVNDKVNNSLLNDSDEDQNEKIEASTQNPTKTESSKLREIVRNFFNCQQTARRVVDAAIRPKTNKYLRQLSDELCKSVEERTHKNDEDRNSDEEDLIYCKNSTDDEVTTSHLHRNGKNRDIKPLVNENGFGKSNCCNSKDTKKSKLNIFKIRRKKATKVIDKDGTDTSSSYGAEALSVDVCQEDPKYSSGLLKRSDSVFSEPEYERIPEVQEDELVQGISRNRLRRSFSAEAPKRIFKETKLQTKIEKCLKFSFGNLILNRFHSGSTILQNKEDTNVTFAELKPDSEIVVDRFRSMSNRSLLSGGRAFLEEIADSFKPMASDIDDPIVIYELPGGVTIPELPTVKSSPPTARVATLDAEGRMLDDSSKCSSLPELFPSKKTLSPDAHRPCFLRQMSGGTMTESKDTETVAFVNPISKKLHVTVDSDTSNAGFPGLSRLSCSIDFSSLKPKKAQCAYCSSTTPLASASSLSNFNPVQGSCNCNQGYVSDGDSSARASSEYLEADFAINVNALTTHAAETYTEDERPSGRDFLNSTIGRSFSRDSLNEENADKSNRSGATGNEEANQSSSAKFSRGKARYL